MTDEMNAEALEALVEQEGRRVAAEDEAAEDQAAFEAAFNASRGSSEPDPVVEDEQEEDPVEAKADEKPAEKPQEQAEAKAQEKPAEKPKAKEEKPHATLEDRLRKVEGRNGQLVGENKQLATQIEQLNSQIAKLTAKPEPKQPSVAEMMTAAMAGGKKLKALQEEFPEFAEALDEQARLFSTTVDRRLDALKEEAAKAKGMTREEAAQMVKEARQLSRIDMKHPGWEDTCQSREFVDWYMGLDEGTKALAKSDRVEDAIRMLDLFNDSLTQKQENSDGNLTHEREMKDNRRKERLERAIPATTGARTQPSRNPTEEEDFLAGFRSARGG